MSASAVLQFGCILKLSGGDPTATRNSSLNSCLGPEPALHLLCGWRCGPVLGAAGGAGMGLDPPVWPLLRVAWPLTALTDP